MKRLGIKARCGQRDRTCERCGEPFYDRQATTFPQRFCSQTCAAQAGRERVRASYPPRGEIVRLYVEEGLSDRALGRRFGRSYQWALGVRRHYGIPGKSRGAPRKPLSGKSDRYRWGIHLKAELWCRNCGAPGELHLHHAIPRSMSKAAKYDLRNGLPLCGRCHGGWHQRSVAICRDVFTAEEWAFLLSVELIGQRIEAWLDERYPAVTVTDQESAA